MNLFANNKVYIIAYIILCALFLLFFLYFPTYLSIEMKVSIDSRAKVYYDTGLGYRERNKIWFDVAASEMFETHRIKIPGRRIFSFRIDPMTEEGSFAFRSIHIQTKSKDLLLEKEHLKNSLIPMNHVELTYENDVVHGISTGDNPVLELGRIDMNQSLPLYISGLVLLVLLVAFIAARKFIVWLEELQKQNPNRMKSFFGNLVMLFLIIALGLIIAMALMSGYNRHPEEHNHFLTAKYYSEHWLPPKIGDPKISDTYEIYGISRLHQWGLYYFFAGKFSALTAKITGNLFISSRLFNVFLFIVIVVMFYRQRHDRRLLFFVFILTPQVWYVFSYVNYDAFSVFLSIVITSQLVSENSFLKKYLTSPGYSANITKGLMTSMLSAMLFLSRANYYVYFLFLALWGGWFLYQAVDRKKIFFKFMILTGAFLCLLAARHGLDYAINGPDRNIKLAETRELMAGDQFKEAVRGTEESFFSLHLREKGVKYFELFSKPWNWHIATFASFTGAYGYMQYFGSKEYHIFIFLLYFLFIAFVSKRLWKNPGDGRFFLLSAFFISIVMLFASSYFYSWSYDFQPQGRYLFPLLGVYAFLLEHHRPLLDKHKNFYLLVMMIAVMSVYSFINYGLANLI